VEAVGGCVHADMDCRTAATGCLYSVSTRLTANTHDPQSRPALVAWHTCARLRAPEATASVTERSLTTAHWQMITRLSSLGVRWWPSRRSPRLGSADAACCADRVRSLDRLRHLSSTHRSHWGAGCSSFVPVRRLLVTASTKTRCGWASALGCAGPPRVDVTDQAIVVRKGGCIGSASRRPFGGSRRPRPAARAVGLVAGDQQDPAQ